MLNTLLPDRGFLPHPDPLSSLTQGAGLPMSICDTLDGLATEMPHSLALQPDVFQARLAGLPLFDFAAIDHHPPTLERLFMLYAYFANAYVHGHPGHPQTVIPQGLAVPFYQLAHLLDRPPILSYATLVLNNWRRIDPQKGLSLDNLASLVSFQNLADEHGFGLVHVTVEAQAAPAMMSLPEAISAARQAQTEGLIQALKKIAKGIKAMLQAFHQMPAACNPELYHERVRPYMFGFTQVIFEGVGAYGGAPQTLLGGSGAQSSTIPALVAALGIQHDQTGLMQHLERMKLYMPRQHRHFIQSVETSTVRAYVLAHPQEDALTAAYNECIQQLLVFRRGHLHYAKVYIFDKVANPLGTGGTPFMDWLAQLLRETEAHLIP